MIKNSVCRLPYDCMSFGPILTNSVLSAPQQNAMLRKDVDCHRTDLNQKKSMPPKHEDVVKKLQLSKQQLSQCLNELQVHGELICLLPFFHVCCFERTPRSLWKEEAQSGFFPSFLIYASILSIFCV